MSDQREMTLDEYLNSKLYESHLARLQYREIKEALGVAATALDVAADWNVDNVQCNPPKDWGLPALGEEPDDGWCSTRALAELLRNLSERNK